MKVSITGLILSKKGKLHLLMKNNIFNKNTKQSASKGARLGIFIYLFLAITKLSGGLFMDSPSIYADGLNNLTDTISSLAVFIGLYLAKKPTDDDHHFDHNKYEPIASFLVSIIMTTIGLNVIQSAIVRYLNKDISSPDLKVLWISLISIILLYITYRYIKFLAKETQSIGLRATSKDMFNDILISISTVIGTCAAHFQYPILDVAVSILVGIAILLSALSLIKDTTYHLSDGFNKDDLLKFEEAILAHPQIHSVPQIRARISGTKVYVDIIIKIDGQLTVTESHRITEEVELILSSLYDVADTDVHVEPY